MRTKLYIVIVMLFVLQGCGVFYKEHSSFTPETIQLGMTKEDFIAKFGRPYKQNFFYDDAGDYCEVFFYKETVLVGSKLSGDIVALKTIFLFVNGKLKSQEQVEPEDYGGRRIVPQVREVEEEEE